jgi:2',3'-cyclic-nucleotide 2'-phosphodiesterase (5'-nucleotidase family)
MIWIWLTALGPLLDEAAPLAPRAADARIVYTGGAGAVGSERYHFTLHRDLARVAAGNDAELVVDRPVHGFFHQGESAFWAESGEVGPALVLLDGEDPSCEVIRSGVALQSQTERVLLPPIEGDLDAALRSLPGVDVEEVVWQRCTAGRMTGLLVGPPDAAPLEWAVERFTVRMGVRYDLVADDRSDPVWVLGLPTQEAGRRIQAIRDRVAVNPGSVYVDAGEFVPGASSVEYGAMSLHRKTGLDALASLEPAALVPGASELAPGPKVLLAEARAHGLPYVATNWTTEDPALRLPPSLRVSLDGTETAFLGFIDPTTRAAATLEGSGVTLSDPIEAVTREVRRLEASDDPPALIVLIGLSTPRLRARMERELRGVDLLIGDHTTPIAALDQLRIELGSDFDRARQPGVSLPVDGVSDAAIRIEDERVTRVDVRAVPVTALRPTDAEVSARITKVRAKVYPGRDQVLVPATGDEPLGTVSPRTLDRLVCEAVLETSGADVVFLPSLPTGADVPGGLTELQVADRLAMLDRLEVHKVDGDRMENFLFQVQGEVDNHCGADVGARFARVRGWFIDTNRTYRVVTTDRVRQSTDLGEILANGSADLALHLPKFAPLVLDGSDTARLSAVALAALRAWRDQDDPDWVESVVGRSSADRAPLWVLDVDRISLRTSTFRRPERPEAYGNVPETLINSPSSFTLGAEIDSNLTYTDTRVWWDVRARGAYTRLELEGETPQEAADDWRVSTSMSLPRLAFPTGDGLRVMPFGEVLLDSEFTPLLDDAGNRLPRQADLSLTVGLAALRWRWVRALRLGAFVNQDLGRLPGNVAGVTVKTPEYGGRLTAETRNDFFSASSLRFETLWDAMVFGNTPQDDAADLRLRVEAQARLRLRLIRWLDGALFVDGFLVQGRVEETRMPAGAVTFGAALDMAAAFRL